MSAYGKGVAEFVLLLVILFGSATIIEIILFILYFIKQTKIRHLALIIFSLFYIPVLSFVTYLFFRNDNTVVPVIFISWGFSIVMLIIAKKEIRTEKKGGQPIK
jgi:hypothetical protein